MNLSCVPTLLLTLCLWCVGAGAIVMTSALIGDWPVMEAIDNVDDDQVLLVSTAVLQDTLPGC